MRKIYLYHILVLFFFSSVFIQAQDQQVVTFISPRSATFNVERMLAGWENVIHQPEKYGPYGAFAFTVEATSSFRPERINQCLFGENIITCPQENTEWNNFITISGSQTENRIPQKDWLADYFGLPDDFKSIVRFKPRVNNFLLNTHFFFGFNRIKHGLYLRCELPVVYTNWDLNMKERIIDRGDHNYVPGYFNATGIERSELLPRFTKFISGNGSIETDDLIFEPLKNSKMDTCSRRLTHYSDFTTILGYDHLIGGYHHVGVGLQCTMPCGNKPKGYYLFEPIIGNGHHWECGVELSAHFRTWSNESNDTFTELFFDVVISHLFSTTQRRSFDIKGSSNSRYMLAQKVTSDVVDNLSGNGIAADYQYVSHVSPIANFTTFNVTVSNNVQADIALMYSYTQHNNTWSFGYSLWRRGCETIRIKDPETFPEKTWALKGDASLVGFIGEQLQPQDLPIGTPVSLSATEHRATINTGTNYPPKGISSDAETQAEQIVRARHNTSIDNPQQAFAGNNQRLVSSIDDTSVLNQINTSIQPQLITFTDIDVNSAATSGFSQKIFTHFNHTIHRNTPIESYLGLGAEIEFGRQAGPTPAIGADKCVNCALSSWGMWLKGGINF